NDGRIRLSQLRDAGMGRFSRACQYAKKIVQKLNGEMRRAVLKADVQQRLLTVGMETPPAYAPAQVGEFIGNDVARDAIGGGGRTREASGRLHGAVSRDHRRCLAWANDQDGCHLS